MMTWLRHQRLALGVAFRRLQGQSLATLLTTLAMGVAISLPGGLYLALANLDRLAGGLPAQPEISVFLDPAASEGQTAALKTRLENADIAQARFLPRDEALAALSASQDLADIAAGLSENPLPDAWIVRPHATSKQALDRLAIELGSFPGVAETHLDSAWAERLQAGLDLGRVVVVLLASLFAVALVAISGNATRVQVLARRDEIQVSQLIGGTPRYIRRPFLYVGALQGLLGGLAAWGVLGAAGAVLRDPIARLAALYGSPYQLLPPSMLDVASVLGFAMLFGWIGAWVAVTRALRELDTTRA